jgi:hypothetical protein
MTGTNKVKIGLLATFLLVVGQQFSTHAANSSIVISSKVNCADIKALRQNSSGFAVYFDPAHAGKKDHFEVNATLSSMQRQNLGKSASRTFSKFRFGTQPVQKNQNRLKFEIRNYAPDMTKGIEGVIRSAKNMTPVNNICQ